MYIIYNATYFIYIHILEYMVTVLYVYNIYYVCDYDLYNIYIDIIYIYIYMAVSI